MSNYFLAAHVYMCKKAVPSFGATLVIFYGMVVRLLRMDEGLYVHIDKDFRDPVHIISPPPEAGR